MEQQESPKNPQKGQKKKSAMAWPGFEPQTLQNFQFGSHMT